MWAQGRPPAVARSPIKLICLKNIDVKKWTSPSLNSQLKFRNSSYQTVVKKKVIIKMSSTLASGVSFPYLKGKKIKCQWWPSAS